MVGALGRRDRRHHRRDASSSWWRAPRSANPCCGGPARAPRKLAQGFRDDAFSYLLFLRLVPAFPFFLVNLVPAFAGVRLRRSSPRPRSASFRAPFVYAFAGTGLDSVIAAQQDAYTGCLAAGRTDCQMTFDAKDVLTPELIGALVALGLLALGAGGGEKAARALARVDVILGYY